MFRQPNFSNLRFNIIQAVNPYIQNSSNKCFGKSIISLPNNKVKSTISLPKKLLNKNFKLTSQPSVDLVTLSPDAKIANVSKPTQDSKVAYGKLIKKVLNRYFDNDNIATDFQKDKKANLKQLVKEFEEYFNISIDYSYFVEADENGGTLYCTDNFYHQIESSSFSEHIYRKEIIK